MRQGTARLKITRLLEPEKAPRICTIEEARQYLEFGNDTLVVVKDQVVPSYEELVALLAKEEFKGQEIVEVQVVPYIIEGG